MADAFAPQLGSNIGFEQPVSLPQVGSALSGLGSTFFGRAPTAGPAPTSEEKFGAAWSQYTKRLKDQGIIDEGQVFTAGTASLSQLRQFGSLYPQFSDDVFSRASTEKNAQLQQIDAEQSGQNTIITEYYSSGEGSIADAQVAQLRAQGKTKEADELEAKSFGEFIQRKAEVSKVADLAKKTTDLTTLSNDTWSINKKAVRAQADIAANGLSELLVAFKADPSGTFDLEASGLGSILNAFPNISITKVNKDNFGEFALQLKSEIMRTQQLRMQKEVGFELRDQPSGYEADVFKGFDAITTWAEKDLDPAEIVKRAKNEGFIRMQESGIPVGDLAAIELISSDPTIQASIIGGFTEDIQKYIGSIKDGSTARVDALKNISTDSMKDARTHFSRMLGVYSGNSTDAKPYPEVTLSIRQEKIRENMLGLIESHSQIDSRTGKPQRFNKAAWDEYFAKNASSVIQIASQDSDFATTVGTTLTNDIMLDIKKIQEVTKDKGVTISFNDKGQIEFGVDKELLISNGIILSDAEAAELKKRSANGDTLARQRLLDYATESNIDERVYISQVVGPEGARKTTANLDDINYKWNVLSQLGQVGSSVKSTIEQEIAIQPTKTTPEVTTEVPTFSNQDSTTLISTAESALGLNEQAQKATLQSYLAEGGVNIDPSQTAWCAAFVNATLGKNGLDGTGKLNARSFLDWGQEVTEPKLGDIVVLSRTEDPALGHVGFFKGFDENGNILILGGNQSDSVSVQSYSKDRLLGYRRAEGLQNAGTEQALSQMIYQVATNPESFPFNIPATLAPDTSLRPQPRPVSAEEITPAEPVRQRTTERGTAQIGDQGLVRVANSPIFDRDLQRFLQTIRVDPETTFSVKDIDELEAAQADGRLKKGDKVLVGEGLTAFVAEIE